MISCGSAGLYRWNTKPRLGTELDISHPWVKFLSCAWLLSEGNGSIVNNGMVGNNNGTIYFGQPPWIVSKYGYSLNLSSTRSNHIEFGIINSINNASKITLFFSGNRLVNNNWSIGRLEGTSNGGKRFGVTMVSNVLYALVENGAAIFPNCTAPTGDFTCALVYDGTQLINSNRTLIYINGNLVSLTQAGNIPSTLASDTTDIFTVGRDNSDGTYTDGRFDFAYLFVGNTLSAQEVRSLHYNPWQIYKPQIDYAALYQKRSSSTGNIYNIPISFDVSTTLNKLPAAIWRPSLALSEQTDTTPTVVRESKLTNQSITTASVSKTSAINNLVNKLYRWNTKPRIGTKLDLLHDLSVGLGLCMPFNEGVGNPIDIISNKQLIVTGSTSWQTSVKSYALTGTGSTQYGVANYSNINNCTSFTVAMLWKCPPGPLGYGRIVEKGANSEWTFDAGETSPGFVSFVCRNGLPVTLSSLTNICDGNWHYIVGTRDIISTKISLYIDGVLVGQTLQSSPTAGTTDDLHFWQYQPSQGSFYSNSSFAGLWIWNRCLSLNEILSHYSNPWQIFEPQINPLVFTNAGQGSQTVNIPISLDIQDTLQELALRASVLRPSIADQTDLSTSIGSISSRGIALDVSTTINMSPVRDSQIYLSMNGIVDCGGSVTRNTAGTTTLDVSTSLSEQIIRSSKEVLTINTSTDLTQIACAAINRAITFDSAVMLQSQGVRSSYQYPALIEQTDLSNTVVLLAPSQSVSSSIDVATTLSVLAGRKTPMTSAISEQTDSIVQGNVLSNRSLNLDVVNTLTDVAIRDSSLSVNINNTTDLGGNSNRVSYIGMPLDITNVINEQIVRTSYIHTAITEQTDLATTAYNMSGRSIGLDTSTTLTGTAMRNIFEYIAFAEQTDVNVSYAIASPSKSISDNLDVAVALAGNPGLRSGIFSGIAEGTDITSQIIRSTLLNNSMNADSILGNTVINASSRFLSIADQVDLSAITGRFRGESISFDVNAILNTLAVGATGATSLREAFDVEVDLSSNINRATSAGSSISSQTDLSLYTVRSTETGFVAGAGTDVNINSGRLYYTVPSIDVLTQLNGQPGLISASSVNFNISDTLTVLVGVAGAIIPIQSINFVLTSVNQLTFDLTCINQLNFDMK